MQIEILPQRNPHILFLKDEVVVAKILCIGDPHLGRVFKTGVPSHRLAEREESQYLQFEDLLNPKDPLIKNIVIMGDLFDKFIVSPTVVLRTFNILKKAVLTNPNINYSIIPGNHDLSKDTTKKSSYELLCVSLEKIEDISENLTVILHSNSYDIIEVESQRFYLNLVAYNPFNNDNMWNKDIEKDVFNTDPLNNGVISFGHWDSLSILESGYTPTQELLDKSLVVISGHEHVHRSYVYPYDVNKTNVVFTGSMQPYSHAEDPEKLLYLTIDTDNLDKYKPEDLKDKCVRLYCDHSFKLEKPIDCLSLSYMIKEREHVEMTEEEIQVLENSYQTHMLNFFDKLGDEFSESLKTAFVNKEYL